MPKAVAQNLNSTIHKHLVNCMLILKNSQLSSQKCSILTTAFFLKRFFLSVWSSFLCRENCVKLHPSIAFNQVPTASIRFAKHHLTRLCKGLSNLDSLVFIHRQYVETQIAEGTPGAKGAPHVMAILYHMRMRNISHPLK